MVPPAGSSMLRMPRVWAPPPVGGDPHLGLQHGGAESTDRNLKDSALHLCCAERLDMQDDT